ncbi:uncharacterized protein LOC123709552 [Pieris brassicae]|uniref:uncharacterized protein LOC123709552 n=1 Tax=Pieris brassicae TaxID=7116 RepID=UPI001E6622B2|nr:uncharacterized protein LOC123709552 [Pieris brassicae]
MSNNISLFKQRFFLKNISTQKPLPNLIRAYYNEKVELSPLLISCGLNDIIIISAPTLTNTSKYYLHRPNGGTVTLDLQPKLRANNVSTDEYNDIQITYFTSGIRIICPVNKYRIFNVNEAGSIFNPMDTFQEKELQLEGNEFMIGPLSVEDHGNWVLSIYYIRNGRWIEVFQVISVEIIEIIPAKPPKPVLNVGEDLEISFAYPIDNMTSCEITAPRSTYDRFYDRSRHSFESCGFLIPNITREDAGLWRIVGVGQIVYEATAFVTIKDVFL